MNSLRHFSSSDYKQMQKARSLYKSFVRYCFTSMTKQFRI